MKTMILAAALLLSVTSQASKMANVTFATYALPTIEVTGTFDDYRLDANGKYQFYFDPSANYIGKAILAYTDSGLSVKLQEPTAAKCKFDIGALLDYSEVAGSVTAHFNLASTSTCAHTGTVSIWDKIEVKFLKYQNGQNVQVSQLVITLFNYARYGGNSNRMTIFQ